MTLRRTLATAAATTTLLLLVGACGGDGPGRAASETPSGASASDTTDERTVSGAASDAASSDALLDRPALAGDGVGAFAFGDPPDLVISGLTELLGDPSEDSGWGDPFSVFGTCPGTKVRGVIWGGLTVLFGDRSVEEFAPEGTDHFFAYTYVSSPPELETAAGIVVGSAVAELRAAYEEAEFSEDEIFGARYATGTGLTGSLTGLEDGDTVASIEGGAGCGE